MAINHDSGRKDIFGHKQVVVDFLRGYVHQPWVHSVDFDSLERVNSSYVHEADQQRIGDVVWRFRLKDGSGWVYTYLLLELQSKIDRHMALRMMVYVGLLYQDLIKQKQFGPDGLLPAIFPAVIYNGKRPWNAPLSLSELITKVPEPMRALLPNMSYYLLDEGRVQPLAPDNILSAIIEMERAPDAKQLSAALERARKLLDVSGNQSLGRTLLAWLKRVVLRFMAPGLKLDQLNYLEELQTMLAENVIMWTQKWEHQGWQKGLVKGREEGREEVFQKAALASAKRGISVAEIAIDLGLDEAEVRRILG